MQKRLKSIHAVLSTCAHLIPHVWAHTPRITCSMHAHQSASQACPHARIHAHMGPIGQPARHAHMHASMHTWGPSVSQPGMPTCTHPCTHGAHQSASQACPHARMRPIMRSWPQLTPHGPHHSFRAPPRGSGAPPAQHEQGHSCFCRLCLMDPIHLCAPRCAPVPDGSTWTATPG